MKPLRLLPGLAVLLLCANFSLAQTTTYYEVWRSETSSLAAADYIRDKDGRAVSSWLTGTRFVDSTAAPGIVYHYWVRAITASMVMTDWSTDQHYGGNYTPYPAIKGLLKLLCPIKAKRNERLTPVRITLETQKVDCLGDESFGAANTVTHDFRVVLFEDDETTWPLADHIFERAFYAQTQLGASTVLSLSADRLVDPSFYEDWRLLNQAAELRAVAELCRIRPYADPRDGDKPKWRPFLTNPLQTPIVSVQIVDALDSLPPAWESPPASTANGILLTWETQNGKTTEFSDAATGVCIPLPVIVEQPQHQSVPVGSTAMFTVYATNHAPLAYQWFKDGVPLIGQTATNLVIANATNSDVGGYSVVITNNAGAVTSVVAVLTVVAHQGGQNDGWVMWPVEVGGNGHWYKAVNNTNKLCWNAAQALAQAQCGYLATITSSNENAFVFNLINDDRFWWYYGAGQGPWIGGRNAGGWSWVSGETWDYSNFAANEPTESDSRALFYNMTGDPHPSPTWGDAIDCEYYNSSSYVIERDAAPSSLSCGLVAYYPFDGNANDASGNTNHGAAHNVIWTTGRSGGAVRFQSTSGHSSYIYVENSSSLDVVRSFSASFWVKPDSHQVTDFPTLFHKHDGETSQYEVDLYGSSPGTKIIRCVFAPDRGDRRGSQFLLDNQWNHVAIIFDGSRIAFYVNGIKDYDQPRTEQLVSVNWGLGFGVDNIDFSNWQFTGELDEVRLYNRALSVAEIAELAGVALPGNPELALIPTGLTPTTTAFQNVADQSFTVRNTGSNTLAYAITTSAPWLTVAPNSGSSSGEADLITVSYDTERLPAGEYSGEIIVTAPGATNSPQTVDVHLTVTNSATLVEALDWPGQEWTASGPAPWAGQVFISNDAQDAARSGPIDDDQQSLLETTVTGPGTLRWWWKVSSESGWDHLRFHFRGEAQFGISGERDWEERSFYVPPGTHAVQWGYSKDRSGSDGQDAAWVDQITFEPSTGLTIVSAPQPQISYEGSAALFSVLARGDQPITYQWRQQRGDGTNTLAGATEPSLLLTNLTPADAGYYFVTVSNVAGVTNVGATLAVRPLPPFEMNSMGQESFGGGFVYRFWVRTPPGADSVRIEVSSNLVTWTPIYTNPTPAPEFLFGEPAVSNQVQKFYRAVAR